MSTIIGAFLAIGLGALGWLSLEFFARPIRRFFDLRQEAQRKIILYAAYRRDDAGFRLPGEPSFIFPDPKVDENSLAQARHEIRDIGSQLFAFGNGEWPAAVILCWFGFHATVAGEQIMHLEREMDEIGGEVIAYRKAAFEALRIDY
jgi:hypothetical protein